MTDVISGMHYVCFVLVVLITTVSCNEGTEFLFPVPSCPYEVADTDGLAYITSMWHRKNVVSLYRKEVDKEFSLYNKLFEPHDTDVVPFQTNLRNKVSYGKVPTIYIQATGNISVSVSAISLDLQNDYFLAIPVTAWGTLYFIATLEAASFFTVSTFDKEVKVEITFSLKSLSHMKHLFYYIDTHKGLRDGAVITIDIEAFSTFQIMDCTTKERLSWSGTEIKSLTDVPVGVMAGNIKSGQNDSYRVLTTSLPNHLWGKLFIVCSVPVYPRGRGDYLLVMATEDKETSFSVRQSLLNVFHDKLNQKGEPTLLTYFKTNDKVECCGFTSDQVLRIESNRNIIVIHSRHIETRSFPTANDASAVSVIPTRLFRSNYIARIPHYSKKRHQIYIQNFIWFLAETKIMYQHIPVKHEAWKSVEYYDDTDLQVHITQYLLGKEATNLVFKIWSPICNERFGGYISGELPEEKIGYFAPLGFAVAPNVSDKCTPSTPVVGDRLDNDCDGRIDEEIESHIDRDGDGKTGEDMCKNDYVNGTWGPWSGWIDCDASNCLKIQYRNCTRVGYGGYACDIRVDGDDSELDAEDITDLGFCPDDINCPTVHGCVQDYWTPFCNNCPPQCQGCDAFYGSCDDCREGIVVDKEMMCSEACPSGTYGHNCSKHCDHCFNEQCDPATGECVPPFKVVAKEVLIWFSTPWYFIISVLVFLRYTLWPVKKKEYGALDKVKESLDVEGTITSSGASGAEDENISPSWNKESVRSSEFDEDDYYSEPYAEERHFSTTL